MWGKEGVEMAEGTSLHFRERHILQKKMTIRKGKEENGWGGYMWRQKNPHH